MRTRFNASQRCSLGIEWELQLVDPVTRQLTSAAVEILGDVQPADGSEHPKAKHELLQSTVEIVTGICQTVAQARADLADTVAAVSAAAERRQLRLMCAGTHPLSNWHDQKFSPNPRYDEMVFRLQWMARRMQVFGVHVHVGVRSPEKAIMIVNALSTYIPHFLAVSASSPFWSGEDTGLASARTPVWEQLPRSGPPPEWVDWVDYEHRMTTLADAGAIDTVRDVWWDVRPHPDFGTVELRMCDGLPTLDEVVAVAALAQCLVEHLDQAIDKGHPLPRTPEWLIRENKWRVVRHGLDAELIVDESSTVVPVRRALLDLADELMPTARILSCADELASLRPLLQAGASYQRQRAVAQANDGDLHAVVDSLIDEMATGLFGDERLADTLADDERG